MARFPIHARFVIEASKIEGYLLNSEHRIGKSKDAYFLAKGFRKEDPEAFRLALENHARTRPVVADVTSPHGRKLTVECAMGFPDGRERCVRTVWISDTPEAFRLVTSYPVKRK